MAEFEKDVELTDTERDAEDLRQRIVAQEEKISTHFEEFSQKIKNSMDWRQYVEDYPVATLSIAAGLGLLASRMVPRPEPPSPVDRISGAIQEAAGTRVGNFIRPRRQNIIIESLKGLALTAVAGMAKKIFNQALSGVGSSATRRASTQQSESAAWQKPKSAKWQESMSK